MHNLERSQTALYILNWDEGEKTLSYLLHLSMPANLHNFTSGSVFPPFLCNYVIFTLNFPIKIQHVKLFKS